MKSFAVLILMFSTGCVFSQIPHELVYVVGCFLNGSAEIQFDFDAEQILHVDFQHKKNVYTVPGFIDPDPSQIMAKWSAIEDSLTNKKVCLLLMALQAAEEKNPPEQREPPDSVLYPADDVQLGTENSLICFVDYFYPPSIRVTWTKNGRPVSEGVSLSEYYPSSDQTFHMFSTLTFTPSEGDIYSCSVEHSALEKPKTRIWEPDFIDESLGADVFCGLGLTLGLVGVTAAVFLIVKARHGQ